MRILADLSVIYDACVLYPAPLRDTLMSLAVTRLFQAHWTDAIHAEWIGNLRESRPDISMEQLNRTRRVMDHAVPDALVGGYHGLVPTLNLPDPDDRHVLAAAIHAGAELIITFNLKDFPVNILSGYGIEARHPDDFVVHLLQEYSAEVLTALRSQRQRLVRPPQSVEEFLDTLARQGLLKTVDLLRSQSELL